jgi:hypothetical protein
LNGDGHPDLAVADFLGDTLYVLLGDGAGGFGPVVGFPDHGTPQSVAIADLDGDGNQDMVTANRTSSDVVVFLGDGNGGMSSTHRFGAEFNAFFVAVADLNGDGTPDMAVANGGSGNVSVLLNLGSCPPIPYCTPKVNSLACTPGVQVVGASSAGSSSGFQFSCANVINNTPGFLYFGTSGSASRPLLGGTLCVHPPLHRGPIVMSGGDPPPTVNCTGIYAMDFNAFAAGALGGHPVPELSIPGTVVNVQWWGHDAGFPPPDDVSLSEALQFVICP